MRIEALNSEYLYSYRNKRTRRANTHSVSFPISIPLWLPYLLPFLLTLSLSILPLLLSTIPSSFFSLSAHLPFDFFLLLSPSPLLLFLPLSLFFFPLARPTAPYNRLSLFTPPPSLSHSLSTHPPRQPSLILAHHSAFSSSSLFRLSPVPPAKLRLDVPFTTRFHPPRPVSSSLSDPFAPCPPLSRVAPGSRASLCAGIVRARARACVRARKIHVGVTPNARCTHVRPEFMGIFSVR